MKIIVSASTNRIDGDIDPRLGRCPYLILVDSETDEYSAIENQGAAAAGGAGIATARKIVELGAQVVITGQVGPNAQDILTQAGVELITGCAGPIREILRNYRDGALDVGSGVGGRPAGRQTQSGGMGRGMTGGGGGMGRGRGGGMGMGGGGVRKGGGGGGGGRGRGRA